MKSCFFIGHREAGDTILPVLCATIERYVVQYGVEDFFVGDYGRFDALATHAVQEVKKRHPKVTLTLLLPYYPLERSKGVADGFDDIFYPPLEGVPRRLSIVRANRYMVDHCTHLIAYVRHPGSNSYNLLEYAGRREKLGNLHIENIAELVICK